MDRFEAHRPGLTSPADVFAAVVPDSAADLPGGLTRALYVGNGGDVVAQDRNGVEVTFRNVGTGVLLPVRVARVMATTTADDLVALY